MITSDVLIIEDEPLIAMDIEDLVTSLGHRVVGVARTQRRPCAWLRSVRPSSYCPTFNLRTEVPDRRRKRHSSSVQRSGHLHHGLPRATSDRRKTGACLSHHQALLSGDGERCHITGSVLRGQFPQGCLMPFEPHARSQEQSKRSRTARSPSQFRQPGTHIVWKAIGDDEGWNMKPFEFIEKRVNAAA